MKITVINGTEKKGVTYKLKENSLSGLSCSPPCFGNEGGALFFCQLQRLGVFR